MADKFKGGVVTVSFTKDYPYFNSEGEAIKNLDPQFKKGQKVKLVAQQAGEIVNKKYAAVTSMRPPGCHRSNCR